ncbi:ribonuclease E/G [Altererythrobacter arenosus]|uniref:Ribonuclease E n=1 Tax=Altererythrobacter arenosus TaxID=3032592 RepID=A0ABY8FQ89_9SPHN|nr:ribonuclease E/G [Altererythrobacter sp. CAU 1644]WFL77172.1 ribonuclease E/G [Altererythrobacter sp. CAU 1644]
MATRMLIDARHPEETRVAVVKNNRIEEFDFESAEHKQIKGNIYLAKVTRVEPSLQAAFVDFGGNRHGFLAFSEIHPDYYQIPQADRERLLAEEAEAAEEEARLRAEEEERGEMPGEEYDAEDESSEALVEDLAEDGLEEIDTSEKDRVSTIEDGHVDGNGDDEDEDDDSDEDESSEADEEDSGESNGKNDRRGRGRRGRGRRQGGGKSRAKEVDEVRARRQALRRRYKIQDVIQRRQVLLVQVVKEERGNKGAALTTYLSLAGRYTVLMPNSSHGGGISRKISSASDRKRLKSIVGDLKLPKTMGLIVRTAGLSRTKPEIKRDFDYLARLWDEIREKTLASTAPTLIHSDSDLIKRAIRDIYNKEIEEVVVEGEEGYKSAKQFMKLLMPSHARRVKAYSDPVPLFQRYGAEDQLRAMYDPVVQLKSGGYLVINPTEALVSIDINSGRSTKEHGIEQTALSTNLEAAREIARQLRLRDMAGLVVIDFIDMEYNSNIRKVEKAMKEALKHDRARIQVGRISGFGLMEMSRQRLRTGVLEATTRDCPHCDGTGLVRTASSAGLSALRLIEDEAAKGKGTIIRLGASTEAAIYLLNAKRSDLAEIEERYGVSVEVVPEGEDEGAKMSVSSGGPRPSAAPRFDPIVDDDDDEDEIIDEDEDDDDRDDDDAGRKKRRRRRRGGRGRNKNRQDEGDDAEDQDEDDDSEKQERRDSPSDDGDEAPRKKRRRSRGGRRRRKNRGDGEEVTAEDAEQLDEVAEQVTEDMAVVGSPEEATEADSSDEQEEPKPKAKRTRRKKAEKPAEEAPSEPVEDTADEAKAEKPKRKRAPRKKKVEEAVEEVKEQLTEDIAVVGAEKTDKAPAEDKPKKPARKRAAPKAKKAEEAPSETQAEASNENNGTAENDDEGKSRRGWWQRTFGE